jgi:APA family basic amino acid/polyamine antiporter
MAEEQIGAEGLRVAIGLPSAVLLVMGGIIGVGIFANPSIVAHAVHSSSLVLIAWSLGGAVALLGAFVYAELAARFPTTGGEYVYLRDTYGPLAGFLYAWTLLLVVQAGGMAAVSIVFAKNLNVLFNGSLSEPMLAVGVMAILAVVNSIGAGYGNGAQTLLGALKIAAIAALIGAGLFLAPHARPAAVAAHATSTSWKDFGAAMIPVVFSYGGWQTAGFVAGEIRDPARNLVRALIIGVAGVIGLYLLINIACLQALGVDALGRTLTPTSDVLALTVGPASAKLAAAAIALSALAFLSQSMLTAPRVCFALARDGLFFRWAARVTEKGRAPMIAILLQAAWTVILALSGRYDQILSYVVSMNFLFFAACASCLFTLRWRERRGEARSADSGFRTPWYPLTTGLFIAACLTMVACSFWAYPVNSLIGYAIMLIGLPLYFYWRRQGAAEVS